MSLLIKHRKKKSGTPPGTLVHMGKERSEKVVVNVITYNEKEFRQYDVEDIDGLRELKSSGAVSWIDVSGVHDISTLEKFGEIFKIHPLMLEDIASTTQRPKVEEYDDMIYLVVKMLTFNEKEKTIESEQISMVLTKNVLITFQETPGDVFDIIRKRLKDPAGRIRSQGADYLAYSLIDAIVDNYFVIAESIGGEIEVMEDAASDASGERLPPRIYQLKRMLLLLRKAVWPLREVINFIEKSDTKLIADSVRPYLRDLYDHTVQIIDAVETYRDITNGIRDVYMTFLSYKMNNVMKILTVIATIFMPITFIAGVYGMNFHYMPELGWKYGYPAVWGVMVVVTLYMLYYFKKKRWF